MFLPISNFFSPEQIGRTKIDWKEVLFHVRRIEMDCCYLVRWNVIVLMTIVVIIKLIVILPCFLEKIVSRYSVLVFLYKFFPLIFCPIFSDFTFWVLFRTWLLNLIFRLPKCPETKSLAKKLIVRSSYRKR